GSELPLIAPIRQRLTPPSRRRSKIPEARQRPAADRSDPSASQPVGRVWPPGGRSPPPAAGARSLTSLRSILGPVLKAVLFDVDFTLFRPGPELGPEGYRRIGERHGLELEPELYGDARVHAIATLQRNHQL